MFVQMSDQEKRELVSEWFRLVDAPIAIDSAGKYGAGLALEVISRELSHLGIAPADVIISNKLAWRRKPLVTPEPTFEPGVWVGLRHDAVQDISYDGIKRCHEDGCRMLGDFPAQLLSVHDPDEYLDAAQDSSDRKRRIDDIVGAYRALSELKAAGEIMGVGIGAKNWQSIRELSEYCEFDWVMMANSFTVMNHPPELMDFIGDLGKNQIGLINSAVTHGGFLTGGGFLDYREINPEDPAHAKAIQFRSRLQEICKRHDVTTYDVCVAFGKSHPAITTLALSTTRIKRVQSMVESVVAKTIPSAVWSDLRAENLISADYPFLPQSS